ncbi:MAG TPA: RNA 2',3'-cyclic phosphodiesterase [Methylophilaceae bacterium]|nr:RNA 2',3'-cyclic phosphodiesterase [Methylophilaceae bacterium]
MARLFVALDLPQAVTARLMAHQPRPLSGIRLIPPDQMHLTLHFIGEAEIPSIADALSAIEYPAFRLTVDGTGQFRTSGGLVLWAGVVGDPQLLGLHAAVGQLLAGIGMEIDSRPYRPHITLARCSRQVTREALTRAASQEPLHIKDITIAHFALYSSTLGREGPSYRQERRYPLV